MQYSDRWCPGQHSGGLRLLDAWTLWKERPSPLGSAGERIRGAGGGHDPERQALPPCPSEPPALTLSCHLQEGTAAAQGLASQEGVVSSCRRAGGVRGPCGRGEWGDSFPELLARPHRPCRAGLALVTPPCPPKWGGVSAGGPRLQGGHNPPRACGFAGLQREGRLLGSPWLAVGT